MYHWSICRERQVLGGSLCDLSMAMVAVRSRRYSVRCTAVVVSIIKLVDRLMVTICENCRFAVMLIMGWNSMFRQLFLMQDGVNVLRDRLEVWFFLERACTAATVSAAAYFRR